MKKILATAGIACGESTVLDQQTSCLSSGEKIIKFTTKIIDLPGPTRNKVIYPVEEMKKAIDHDYVQFRLKQGSLYGEPAHPLNPEDLNRWFLVDKTKATHKWTKLWFEGNALMGECQTFSGAGNLMYHALLGGELPAFSIRVTGEPRSEQGCTVLSNITLISIDWIDYPGNPTSYVSTPDVFNVETAPGLSYLTTSSEKMNFVKVAKAESMNMLGVNDNKLVYKNGNGLYTIYDKINNNELNKYRLNNL